MGLMDSIREAFGGDPDHRSAPPAPVSSAGPRHVDRDAPAETIDDARLVTGGKHAARD
jgi:hypothetical protein